MDDSSRSATPNRTSAEPSRNSPGTHRDPAAEEERQAERHHRQHRDHLAGAATTTAAGRPARPRRRSIRMSPSQSSRCASPSRNSARSRRSSTSTRRDAPPLGRLVEEGEPHPEQEREDGKEAVVDQQPEPEVGGGGRGRRREAAGRPWWRSAARWRPGSRRARSRGSRRAPRCVAGGCSWTCRQSVVTSGDPGPDPNGQFRPSAPRPFGRDDEPPPDTARTPSRLDPRHGQNDLACVDRGVSWLGTRYGDWTGGTWTLFTDLPPFLLSRTTASSPTAK